MKTKLWVETMVSHLDIILPTGRFAISLWRETNISPLSRCGFGSFVRDLVLLGYIKESCSKIKMALNLVLLILGLFLGNM